MSPDNHENDNAKRDDDVEAHLMSMSEALDCSKAALCWWLCRNTWILLICSGSFAPVKPQTVPSTIIYNVIVKYTSTTRHDIYPRAVFYDVLPSWHVIMHHQRNGLFGHLWSTQTLRLCILFLDEDIVQKTIRYLTSPGLLGESDNGDLASILLAFPGLDFILSSNSVTVIHVIRHVNKRSLISSVRSSTESIWKTCCVF